MSLADYSGYGIQAGFFLPLKEILTPILQGTNDLW
jgi:hypothetical protein